VVKTSLRKQAGTFFPAHRPPLRAVGVGVGVGDAPQRMMRSAPRTHGACETVAVGKVGGSSDEVEDHDSRRVYEVRREEAIGIAAGGVVDRPGKSR
jgi:hypothetical protein